MSVTTNAKRGKPDPQSDFPLLTETVVKPLDLSMGI